MNLREFLTLKNLGLGIVTFTAFIVLVLGGWLLLSIFSDPSLPQYAMYLDGRDPAIDREPSSIPVPVMVGGEQELIEVTKQNTKIEIVKLGCIKDGSRIELKSGARQLRLKGQMCQDQAISISKSSIINRANGFEASLFNLRGGEFTSDYISLDEGSNQLLLEMDSGMGSRATLEILISRQ